MKRLLLLGLWLLPFNAAHAGTPPFRCPGETTVEMRYCVSQSWEQSDRQLRRKIAKGLFQQWQDATRAVCARAYAPYRDGTIYPQLVVACDDHLNRALLQELKPLDAR
ncbi:MAG: lysozyme inhibitor LprI family protein [Cyanobium sp.]